MKRRLIAFVLAMVTVFSLGAVTYYASFGFNNVFRPFLLSDQSVVIDAGHGGEDGGAVSPSGAIESHINLAIALRLDEIMGMYGVNTVLLRDSDISLHDSDAETLRQKKVSDLKNRVSKIEALSNPTLISIHQNTYSDSQYRGAQVFYTNENLSLKFAQTTQETLKMFLDPTNNRQAAKVPESVYLMNHVSCRAILVECGFLSNAHEEMQLQTEQYQTKIAAALTGAYLKFQYMYEEGESFDAS